MPWDAADVHRHTQIVGGDGDLEGAHLVGDIAVAADGVGGTGEYIHMLVLHHIGGHVDLGIYSPYDLQKYLEVSELGPYEMVI